AKAAGVQAIFTPFNPAQYVVLLKQADELNLKVPFFSVWTTESPVLIDQAKQLTEGIIYTYAFSEGSTIAYGAFKDSFFKKYNHYPDINASNGYDVIKLLAQGAKSCSGNVQCMIDKTNSIEKYDGMSGSFSFKNNVADKKVFLKTIKDGKFIEYK
ncbi:MAG: ABC transporter substrate-binding protein, partial [Patescibacteria group bacterium]